MVRHEMNVVKFWGTKDTRVRKSYTAVHNRTACGLNNRSERARATERNWADCPVVRLLRRRHGSFSYYIRYALRQAHSERTSHFRLVLLGCAFSFAHSTFWDHERSLHP